MPRTPAHRLSAYRALARPGPSATGSGAAMTDTAHPGPVLRFTTRDVAAPARSRALWELREQGLLPIEPLLDRVPAVDLLKLRLPGTSILAGTFAGVRQGDDPGLAGADG